MAGYDGSIRINTLLNTGDFVSSFRRLGSSIRGLLGTLGLGLGIAGLVSLGKQAVETASNIQEVQNVVDTAFGSMSYKMEEFAKASVKQFGISQLSAKQLGSTFMAMGASMLGNMEKASDMAINLTARAADMASFYNKSVKETSTALKSIYTGETESLKEYGVVMTQVNLQEFARQQGINKSIQAMTQAEKVELQYAYVMQQTSLAAGDFAKTSDSWANQTRILSEQFKELLSVIGSGLITVLTPVVKFLNTILTQLIAIAKQIGAILSKLFGISLPTSDASKFASELSAAAGGADELTEGIEEAGKAAKNAVALFDDLQVLAKDSGSGGAAGEGGIGGGFEMPDLDLEDTEVEEVNALSSAIDGLLERLKPLFDWFTKLKNLFVEGFFDGLGESWKERIADIEESARNIIKTLTEIFTAPSVVAAAQTMIEKTVYAMGQTLGAVESIGIAIGQNLVGGIDIYLTDNKDFLKEKLISIFDIAGDIALLIGQALDSIAYIFEAFGSESGQQLTANIIGIFVDTTLSLLELAGKFGRDILNCIVQPISDNKEQLRVALEGLLGVAAEVSGTVKQGIDDTFAKITEVYDAHFKPFFDSIAQGLSDLTGKILVFWNKTIQPILEYLSEKFEEVFGSHVQPMLNSAVELFGQLADALKALWENILLPLLNWIIEDVEPNIAAIILILGEVFIALVETISTKAEEIINAISIILDYLENIFKGGWDAVWKELVAILANTIVPTFSIVSENIVKIFDGLWGKIKNVINSILGGVEKMANGVVNAINTVIRALNGLSFDIPDWIPGELGGKTFGFNIGEVPSVNIPRLATGAVIRGGNPFMAILGDQPAGVTNIETPLPTMVDAFKQAIAEMGGIGGNERVPVNINLTWDGETFARLSISDILSELGRQGFNVDVLGVN